MLDAVGLDAEQTAVYRHLLRVPSASVHDVAREQGISEPAAREAVAALEQLGLLARQVSAPERVVASPPAHALRPMLLEQERRLSAAHEALLELSELYRQGAARREVADVIDVVRGTAAVRQRFAQLQAAALERVDAFVLTDVAFLQNTENVEEDRALHRGVRYRVVVESGLLERPGFVDDVREAAGAGEEVRVLPALPTRLLIVDDAVALVPMRSHGEDRSAGALLVHPGGLLDLMVSAFESHWQAATRLRLDGDPGDADGQHDEPEPGALDRALLELLLLGLTDAAAGAQLGMSLRTVQRRLAVLMRRAGVDTRLQLGAAAVRQGWA